MQFYYSVTVASCIIGEITGYRAQTESKRRWFVSVYVVICECGSVTLYMWQQWLDSIKWLCAVLAI